LPIKLKDVYSTIDYIIVKEKSKAKTIKPGKEFFYENKNI